MSDDVKTSPGQVSSDLRKVGCVWGTICVFFLIDALIFLCLSGPTLTNIALLIMATGAGVISFVFGGLGDVAALIERTGGDQKGGMNDDVP